MMTSWLRSQPRGTTVPKGSGWYCSGSSPCRRAGAATPEVTAQAASLLASCCGGTVDRSVHAPAAVPSTVAQDR